MANRQQTLDVALPPACTRADFAALRVRIRRTGVGDRAPVIKDPGVVQTRVTVESRNFFASKAPSILGVTLEQHPLNRARLLSGPLAGCFPI
jgi:hypothetical protein